MLSSRSSDLVDQREIHVLYHDLKADFQSVQFSERAEILLFAGENVALKLNRYLRLSNFLLSRIPPAWKIPPTGKRAFFISTSFSELQYLQSSGKF